MTAPKRLPPLAKRVRNGAELLDARFPRWRELVNVESLRMHGCFSCVLGQVFTMYWTGLESLGLTADESVRLGFQVPLDGPENKTSARYAALTDAWKDYLGASGRKP